MTEISKANLIKRWERMATSEELNPGEQLIAAEMAEMAKSIFETGAYRNPLEWLARKIRGYVINEQPEPEDFHYISCLNLNVVQATAHGMHEFDYYMMNQKGWADKYHRVLGI